MNLLDKIKEKKKDLKQCSTVITTLSGHKFLETSNSLGCKSLLELSEISSGYVIDEEPDLKVAQVLPFLFLGSQDAAMEENLLTKLEITHILSIGVQPVDRFDNICYKYVNLVDLPEENLINVLKFTNDLIDHVRKRPPSKIFVHCNAGYSRAPAVVIGYLIFKHKVSFVDAFNSVNKLRNIKPNEGFQYQLKTFSKSLLQNS